MLEEARMLGQLQKQGWTPKRTIIYCAWDGEEPGLLGSTEWVETHVDELRKHAVTYINSDGNGRGYLYAGGTQDLQTVVSAVAHDVNIRNFARCGKRLPERLRRDAERQVANVKSSTHDVILSERQLARQTRRLGVP